MPWDSANWSPSTTVCVRCAAIARIFASSTSDASTARSTWSSASTSVPAGSASGAGKRPRAATSSCASRADDAVVVMRYAGIPASSAAQVAMTCVRTWSGWP